MKTHLDHIQFIVRQENVPFYKDLLTFLGWTNQYEGDGVFGAWGAQGEGLWFTHEVKDVKNDYDGPGMNHIGIHAESPADVDATVEYLRSNGVDCLFDTPRHRPEFAGGEDRTYYQVMFKTPDNLLVEVVYQGPKG